MTHLKQNMIKITLLSCAIALIFAAYTSLQVIKESIFVHLVGRYYINYARYTSIIFLTPVLMAYNKLINKVNKYTLLAMCCTIYAGALFACSLFFTDHIIGIANTHTHKWRLFGWIFFFIIEAFPPFVLGVYWAFVNSITNPEEAKSNYGILSMMSMLSGIITTGLCWWLFASHSHIGAINIHARLHQYIAIGSGCVLLGIIPLILILKKTISKKLLKGYISDDIVQEQIKDTSFFAGFKLIFGNFYVFGMLCFVAFYETLSIILSYLRLGYVQTEAKNISCVSALLFQIIFIAYFVGFILSFFARILLQKLGERICLLLVPLGLGFIIPIILFADITSVYIIYAFILLRAMNYSFSRPIKEMLYIPTSYEIRFKAKSWIEVYGIKIAKSLGSSFNILCDYTSTLFFIPIHVTFFSIIIIAWFYIAYEIGKKYNEVVQKHTLIE